MALTQCFNGVKGALFQRMDIELLPTTIFHFLSSFFFSCASHVVEHDEAIHPVFTIILHFM